MSQLKINVALACIPSGACVVFSENCWWHIPASHDDSLRIAETANHMAGRELDAIIIKGGEIIFQAVDEVDEYAPDPKEMAREERYQQKFGGGDD
jgi:hypothetical protein